MSNLIVSSKRSPASSGAIDKLPRKKAHAYSPPLARFRPRDYAVSAARTSLSANELFGHSHACPGLCDLASSEFFLASRTATRMRSRYPLLARALNHRFVLHQRAELRGYVDKGYRGHDAPSPLNAASRPRLRGQRHARRRGYAGAQVLLGAFSCPLMGWSGRAPAPPAF